MLSTKRYIENTIATLSGVSRETLDSPIVRFRSASLPLLRMPYPRYRTRIYFAGGTERGKIGDNGVMGFNETIKQFIGVFAIVDPIGAVFFFLSLTQGQSPRKCARTAVIAPLSMGAALIIAAFAGEWFLWFFGITIHSFMVGGGVLIFFTAIAMFSGYAPWAKRPAPEQTAELSAVAVVPLGIPLLAGPGAITTVVIGAQSAKGAAGMAILIGIIIVISIITFFLFLKAQNVSRLLGPTGMNIFTRLLGLLLAAISIEIIANGLKGLFPILARPF